MQLHRNVNPLQDNQRPAASLEVCSHSFYLRMQAGDSSDRGVQLLAVQLLGLTAEASVMNCGKLAALGAGGSLAALANTALERPADRQLRWDLIRCGMV